MNWASILSAASLGLCCLFFLYFRRYVKRRTEAQELLAEYRTEVYRLIAEIDAATDRDALLVEERIKTLKQLLEDTDKRIAVYVRELDRSRSGEVLYASLGRGIRAALNPPSPPAAAETAAPVPAAFSGPPETDGAGETVPRQAVKADEKHAAAEKTRLKAHITELAAGGLTPTEIASRLGLSLSEVDLALSLAGRGAS
jgi:DNA-directed RNA polymerase specialized sigma24 family protein